MENRFEIILYPKYEDVFADDSLSGIFYPLCTIVDKKKYKNKVLHFVSSNGIWTNEDIKTKINTTEYTLFSLHDNKYVFNGDVRLYQGFEVAKRIFPILMADFEKNGKEYLANMLKTEEYIEQLLKILALEPNINFDIEYYLQAFYEFSINKLNYKESNTFGEFRSIIDGWGSKDEKSPIVYDETTSELQGTLNHYDKPNVEDFNKYDIIGKILGFEFFTDGNDIILLYNATNEKVLCVNFYS